MSIAICVLAEAIILPLFLSMLRVLRSTTGPALSRALHTSSTSWSGLANILADSPRPAVQVNSITPSGQIELSSGLLLSSACIFLSGKVFLWEVPLTLWDGWSRDRFDIFEVAVPKPEILLFGTGRYAAQIPPTLRSHLRDIGLNIDVMDTRNACSTYNLLAEEGRNVAAALLPLASKSWKSQ